MPLSRKINYPTQAYQNRSIPVNPSALVNMYFENTPQDSKNTVIHGTSGLKTFSQISSEPVYAMHTWRGNIYAVVGNNLYKIDSVGGFIDLGTIGTVTQAIQIFDNNVSLVIVNTQNGSTFVYDGTDLLPVTDPDFRNPSTGTFIDGYAVYSERDSDRIFYSNLNNALVYDSLDFTTAEADSDNLVRVFATYGELWAFGERSIEIYVNSGNANNPFVTQRGANIQQGCGAALSVAQIQDVILWLGEDLSIYAAQGYSKQRVSTHAIEDDIRKYSRTDDAIGFAFTENGHNFYCIVFPEGKAWVHDIATGRWHRRKTFEKDRWCVNAQTFAFGRNYVGDCSTGNIYELDLDTFTENNGIIEREGVLPPLFNDTNPIFLDKLQIDFEAGVGLQNGQGSDPQVSLQRSQDGGKTFGNELWRGFGKIGKYNAKAEWRQLGRAIESTYKYRITDPVKVSIAGIYAIVRGGQS